MASRVDCHGIRSPSAKDVDQGGSWRIDESQRSNWTFNSSRLSRAHSSPIIRSYNFGSIAMDNYERDLRLKDWRPVGTSWALLDSVRDIFRISQLFELVMSHSNGTNVLRLRR